MVAENAFEIREISELHCHRQSDNLTLAVKNGIKLIINDRELKMTDTIHTDTGATVDTITYSPSTGGQRQSRTHCDHYYTRLSIGHRGSAVQ